MTTTNKQLRQYIEQIERLEEEKQGIQGDISDVYAVAKSEGFDVKAMKIVVRRRRKSRTELQEEDALVETYESAVEAGELSNVA